MWFKYNFMKLRPLLRHMFDSVLQSKLRVKLKTTFSFVLSLLVLGTSLAQTPANDKTASTTPQPRIITLAPHLAQLAHAAGAGAYLVGVSEYTPKTYQAKLPTVGNAYGVDWKRVAALKPSLALVWGSGTSQATQARLKALGIPMFVSEPKTLLQIEHEALALAERLGIPDTHPNLLALHASLAELGNFQLTNSSMFRKPSEQNSVFHPIWHKPLMTISNQHVINDALSYCALSNVFATAPGLTPTVSAAQVLRARPAYLLLAQDSSQNMNRTLAQYAFLLDAFPAALRPKPVFVNGDNFHQPGPSMIAETLRLCQQLH